MAFSWQEQIKPAGTQDIQCDIEYLDKSYIHVYLDGAETTAFTWTSATNIRLNSPLSAETVVLLIRKTEREYLYIEFASGAPFIEVNVDTQNTQFLHLAQELVEGRYIEGFYGDINMHRYRITNLGDPVDVRDAANKQYVDAGDARLDQRIDAERVDWMAADAALDARTTNLEQTHFNANTNSFPWWTVLTVATDTVTPGMPFTKAKVRLNGVTQTAGYSYTVNAGVIKFAEVLPVGTVVDCTIGIDTEADTSAVANIMGMLTAPDGYKYIGECPDLATLRGITPGTAYQKIKLRRAVADGPIIDLEFFYDPTDTTSPDDGYRIIVTPGGHRWVTDCADGIDLRLGGLLADGSNFGAAANKIIRGEVKKIIDTATSFIRIVQAIKVPHPTYLSKNAHYTLDEQIIIPSFMGFTCSGWIDVRTSLTGHAIWVRNDETAFPGLKFNMGGYVNLQGFGAVRNANGRLRLLGPGATVSQGAGLVVGTPIAPVANASQINTRDICVSGIHVSGFKYGIGLYGYDNYIHTYEFCEISRCMYPIAGLDINKQNSGERILFRSCTIGGTSHNIYWNLVGWNITFDNCSIDYAGSAMLYLGNGARGCVLRFTNGTFIEGFGTRLVSQDSTSDAWEYDGGRKNKLFFHGAFINAQKKPGEFSSRRQIFASSSDMLGHIELVDTEIRWPDPESEPHVALLGYNDATATRVRGFFRNANTPYDQCLMRYGDSLNAGLYRLNGTEGAAVTLDPATNLTFSLSGGMTATYGGIDPEDGLVFVNLTATAETDTLEIRNQSLRTPVNRFNQLFSALSMKMSAVTAGAVTLATKLYYYGAPTLNTSLTGDTYTTTLSGSTYSTSRNSGAAGGTFQTTRTFTFLGSATGATRDVSSLLAIEDTPLTTEKYVGVQTYCEVAYQYALGTLKASPAIRVGGWVGTIQIKLPVYWIPKGTEANATSD